MALRTTLYSFQRPEISINIEARFEEESLIIEGQDLGKNVEEFWGDSDYEYISTIPPEGVQQLYTVMGLPTGAKEQLLQVLSQKYNSNSCYSELQRFLDDHNIKYESFTWT
jgi:hypothetical protein